MSAYWQMDIDKEWLRVEYLDKMRSMRDIAKEVGCALTTIWARLREYNIPVRRRGEHNSKRYVVDKEWLEAEYLDKMRNTADIAEEIGCDGNIVLHRLYEYGIPVRSSNETRKLTINDYYVLAKKHDFEWIGDELPASNKVKTWWRCSQGHEWEIRYSSIQQRNGCPVCARLGMRGENHPNWRGGTSFEPYGSGFDKVLKLKVRTRDNFTCQISGKPENGVAHSVHHIDYDKKNNRLWNLITLTKSWNGRVNANRDAWQRKLSAIVFARHYSQGGDIRWVENI